jgi:Flp pilus assembly protein TadB
MIRFTWSDPQTLWLNVTNLALLVVTLLAVLVGVAGVMWEWMRRRRRNRQMAQMDDELRAVFGARDVGLTMADGGEPVEHPEQPRS